MSPIHPYAIARYGVYLAVFVAALSVWLGHQAGASLDYALMRAVFIFVVFTAIGFAAEAVLTVGWQQQPPRRPSPEPAPEQHDE